jgi:hypothetical protein
LLIVFTRKSFIVIAPAAIAEATLWLWHDLLESAHSSLYYQQQYALRF